MTKNQIAAKSLLKDSPGWAEPVMRWALTWVPREGARRTLFMAQQGRFTYDDRRDADLRARAFKANGSMAARFGVEATASITASRVPCWPGHFDPVGVFAGDDDEVEA